MPVLLGTLAHVPSPPFSPAYLQGKNAVSQAVLIISGGGWGHSPATQRRDFKASVSSPALGLNTRIALLMSSGIHPETALASLRSLPGQWIMLTVDRRE